MNSFYTTLYSKFAGLQIDQSFSARLIYPASTYLPSLKIGKEIYNCRVGIPSIRVVNDSVSYGMFVFENNSEFGPSAAVKLAVASTCLLGTKSIFCWLYRDYVEEWISSKSDALRANYVSNIMFDSLAKQRIRDIEGDDFFNDIIGDADTLSAVLLKHDLKDFSELTQATLASHLMNTPIYAPAPVLKIAQDFLSELKGLEFDVSEIIGTVTERIAPDDSGSTDGKLEIDKSELGWDRLMEMAEKLYKIIIKVPGKWCNVYLPYSNVLNEAIALPTSYHPDLFKKRLITEQEYGKIAHRASKRQDHNDNSLWYEIFFEFSREEKRREKVLAKLSHTTKNQNFNSVGFPICDYVAHYRLYTELAPQIRRIVERVRLVKNVLDENTLEESGNIDLQVAIQAIASETPRSDIFTKDENLLKSESWTILIDSSMSLGGSSREVKAVSICLAEAAREVMGSRPWAMFAFSDEFYCIKDYTEPYDSQIRSRIGGMTQKGLSYIPDAIRTCRSLILEHASDRNYIILVSDGNATGYANIEEDFKISVKELGRYGINIAAIGIIGSGIKRTIREAKIINQPSDIVKEFMEIYYALSS